MQPKPIKTLAAALCLAVLANACALPEASQIPSATKEQATMTECPTPQNAAMIETGEGSTGVAVLSPSPAEPLSNEAVELTAQQVLSREQMLDRVNAGPQRDRGGGSIVEPLPPGTESQAGGDQTLETTVGDATPTPCP